MLPDYSVFIGIAISAIGLFSYFIDTIKGNIQPNRVSFALWSIAPIITALAAWQKGAGIQALMPLSVGVFPLFIFLATFVNKKAYWKIGKFDIICGSLSLLGLLLWYITKEGNLAIVFSIAADALAYGPTFSKAYKFPETESALPWMATGVSGLCTLLTIKELQLANAAFPAYYFIINIIMFIVVQFKLGKKN